ncbi:hypothetical protein [Synechococcus sp. W4D4]|uniref:hypothetical protein n=1 Tax=Synechococcus sp. W4D4 TaxID=3392294 RepID=UPI0039E8EDBE
MKQLSWLLGAGLALAAVQQQLLLKRPPHVRQLDSSTLSSGPAALNVEFSRPMQRNSVASASELSPRMRRQWLGAGNLLRLLLEPGQTIAGPLQVVLRGEDQRGIAISPERFWWDPRPRLLVVAPGPEGDRLDILQRDGRWRTLSRANAPISSVTPLGNGSGIAFSTSGERTEQTWLLELEQQAVYRSKTPKLVVKGLKQLLDAQLTFTHFSTNSTGDLLVQWGAPGFARSFTTLVEANGQRRRLDLEASGTAQLLPGGGALIAPEADGLVLSNLPGRPQRRQFLPGSRDLSSFCPTGGRALLVRRWPDYRQSIELLEPGQAPKQLWIGLDAVMGTACERSGERIWLLLTHWDPVKNTQTPRVIAMSRSGVIQNQRELKGWELETRSHFELDSTRDVLLLTLRNPKQKWGRAAELQASDLELSIIDKPIKQAFWLPAQ